MARRAKRRSKLAAIGGRYWLTPKVWNRTCWHCSGPNPVALRPRDNRCACELCIKRLGISVGAGGFKPKPVEVRFECPLCGGPHPRSEHMEGAQT